LAIQIFVSLPKICHFVSVPNRHSDVIRHFFGTKIPK
jgi:hypothetical protein